MPACDGPHAAHEKTPEIRGSVDGCHSPANADVTTKWARLDSTTPAVSPEKKRIQPSGAVKGAADSTVDGFATSIAAIMALPLSDTEKAEAVRRLLADRGLAR